MSDLLEEAKGYHDDRWGEQNKELIGKLIVEVEGLRDEHHDYSVLVNDHADQVILLDKEIASLTKYRDECERQYQEKVAEIGTMLDEKQKLEAENDKKSNRILELVNKIAASEKARKDAEEKVERYEKDFESLKNYYKREV